jgi:hypothetical protein
LNAARLVARVRAGATFTAAYFLPDELASIGDVFPPGVAAGDRYADMSLLNR